MPICIGKIIILRILVASKKLTLTHRESVAVVGAELIAIEVETQNTAVPKAISIVGSITCSLVGLLLWRSTKAAVKDIQYFPRYCTGFFSTTYAVKKENTHNEIDNNFSS